MTLTVEIFGLKLAQIDLKLPERAPEPTPVKVVEKAVGGMSKWWIKKMFT